MSNKSGRPFILEDRQPIMILLNKSDAERFRRQAYEKDMSYSGYGRKLILQAMKREEGRDER
jgi:hypothetical protein